MAPREEKAAKADVSGRSQSDDKSADVEQLRQLYDLMVEEGISYLEVQEGDASVRLNRQRPPVSGPLHLPAVHPGAPAATPAAAAEGQETEPSGSSQDSIDSPLAGVFYRASSPTGPSFVKEGDTVEPGQTLCIVEAMKVMNEIKAEARCRITKIAVENARPVTAGQALFHVEPA